MTDAMFTTTTADELGERVFRVYLACSWIGPDGDRWTIPGWEDTVEEHARQIAWESSYHDVDIDAVLAAAARLVADQRVIDRANAKAHRARVAAAHPDAGRIPF